MTEITDAMVEAAAKTLCDSSPRIPYGCAALCMDRPGSIPKGGCAHRVAVHGKRARTALQAAFATFALAQPQPNRESELPDWDDLRGRAPDATGSLSSEDFVRQLRDDWDCALAQPTADLRAKVIEECALVADKLAAANEKFNAGDDAPSAIAAAKFIASAIRALAEPANKGRE